MRPEANEGMNETFNERYTTQPLVIIHLDHLTLEPCKGQYESVLVVTDHFTRYAQAYAVKNQTALTTAKVL